MSAEEYGGDLEPKHLLVYPTAIEVTADGTRVELEGIRTPNVSDEEARELTAVNYGLDPESVVIRAASRNSRRTFGFSNWSGSKWEPTGPKGDPSLN